MITELSVVVPAFNEKANIPLLFSALDAALGGIQWEMIVVDDDSPDGTAATARQMATTDPRIRCLQRIDRRGLSSACIEGILASAAPYVAVMDADLQHDERILPEMLQQLRHGAELVVGTRYAKGGSTGELASHRVLISRMATAMSNLVLKVPCSDPMSGFFMLRRTFFERVMHRLSGQGFKILLDLMVSAGREVKLAEVAYDMRARQQGESKLDTLVVWEYLLLILDKLVGRIIPVRFLLFVGVGAIGLLVHLALLALLLKGLAIEFIYSQTLATIIAMTNNFVLNNLFTYRDRRLRGWGFVRGLISFYAACSIGAVINVQISQYLYQGQMVWWLAGTLGAVIGAIWNYAITSTFTWSNRKTRT